MTRASVSKQKKDTKNRRLNIGLVGNASVGKTTLIETFSSGIFKPTVSTVGLERTLVSVQVCGEPIDCVMWDPAGQEQFTSITKNFFNKVDAIVLVFDMTQADTFEGVLRWF